MKVDRIHKVKSDKPPRQHSKEGRRLPFALLSPSEAAIRHSIKLRNLFLLLSNAVDPVG